MNLPAHIGEYDTAGWSLVWDFRIEEPSLLKNQWKRMHWAQLKRYITHLSWMIALEIRRAEQDAPRIVQIPLQKAWVHVERGSFGVAPDPDGIIGGFAPILDILTCPRGRKKYGLGLIQDDTRDHIERQTAHSVRTKAGCGYTRVMIYTRAG